MYRQLDNGIQITVVPEYVEEQSSSEHSYYFYTYTVYIKNLREEPVQLLDRYWLITDGSGHKEEVVGEGVIGQKPILQPGEEFSYTSYCPLRTRTGNMRGFYSFSIEGNHHKFRSKIPVFFLRTPDTFTPELEH